MNTHTHHEPQRGDDEQRSAAVAHGEAGATAWRAALRAQRAAAPEHGEFYALAGELVDTLRSLTALAAVLAGQVSRYGHGRVLRDDEAGHDPGERRDAAGRLAAQVGDEVGRAEGTAGRFWSSIGHLGLEPPATPEGPATPKGPAGIDPAGDPS